MKTFAFALFLILARLTLDAQPVILSGEIQYATYSMSSLKSFQQDAAMDFSTPLTVVSSFPPFIAFQVQGLVQVTPIIRTGIFAGLNSTGGSLQQQDYSGSIRRDMLCRGISFGSSSEIELQKFGPFSVGGALLVGLMLSSVDFKSEISLTTPSYTTSNVTFHSTGFIVTPGVWLQRQINNWTLSVKVSYVLESAGELKSSTNSSIVYTSKPLTAQWSGFRFGIGFGYTIGPKQEKVETPK